MSGKCLRKGCDRSPLKLFCKEHLKHPPAENIMFTKEHCASPISFNTKFNETSESALNNSMASALQMMSPLNLKKSASVRSKIKEKLKKSVEHNEKHLKVETLEKKDYSNTPRYYSPFGLIDSEKVKTENGDADIWCNSDDFLQFAQLEDRHQLVLDSETNEFIFFIPRLLQSFKISFILVAS